MRQVVVTFVAMLLAAGVLPASAAARDGELSLLGSTASGDYGTGLETDTHWLTLRYVKGNDLQFRAGLSMVRVENLSAMSLTSLGPTTTGGHRRQGSHQEAVAPPPAPDVTLEEDWTTGMGDLYLAVSKRVAGGGVKLFRFDTNVEVKVPTADEDDNLGTGEWDYRFGFAGEYRFWSATAYGGLGWNRLGDPEWVEFNDVLDVIAGIDGEPVLGDRVIFGGWVEGWQEAVDDTGNRASIGFGLRTTGGVRWRLQMRAGLTDPAPDLQVTLGVSFGLAPAGPGVRGPQR